MTHIGDNEHVGDGFTIYYNVRYCNDKFIIRINEIFDTHLQMHIKDDKRNYSRVTTLLDLNKDVGDMIYRYSLMRREIRLATVIGDKYYPGLIHGSDSVVCAFIDNEIYKYFARHHDGDEKYDNYYNICYLISKTLESYPTRSGPKNANSAIAPI